MRPVTMEEKIICYADKFFSKDGRRGQTARSIPEIVAMLRRHGAAHVHRFQAWSRQFENGRHPRPTAEKPD
jgi:uncharacterized protein